MLCKSGKKVFTRVVWSKLNFLLYCMFDTLTLMNVEIFSLVTFVMQFFKVALDIHCLRRGGGAALTLTTDKFLHREVMAVHGL